MEIFRFKEEEKSVNLQKIAFAVNYTTYYVEHIGLSPEFDLENPISLVGKIIFQLENENENENGQKGHQYGHVERHLTKLKSFHGTIEEMDSGKEILRFIESSNIKNKNELNNKKVAILKSAKDCKKYLDENLFNESKKVLTSIFCCEHELGEHLEEIKTLVKLISSEVLFTTQSKSKAISVLKSAFSSGIYAYSFPQEFLNEINHLSTKEQKLKREEFLKEVTWSQRFDTIRLDPITNKMEYTYLFRIGNLDPLETEYLLNFGKVQFHGSKEIVVERFRGKLKDNIKEEFFIEKYKIFSSVKIEAYSYQVGRKIALNHLKTWLDKINAEINGEAFVDKVNFLFTTDFEFIGYNLSSSGRNRKLTEIDRSNLEDLSKKILLEDCSSLALETYKKQEPILLKAQTNKDFSKYWEYLVGLLGDKFIGAFSNLIEPNCRIWDKVVIKQCIYDSFDLLRSSGLFGIGWEDQKQLRLDMLKDGFDFSQIKSKQNNQFINFLVDNIENYSKKESVYFIKYILNDLREVRNFIQHHGNHCVYDRSKIRLEISIHYLVNRLRTTLTELMMAYPEKELKELITTE